MNTIIRTLIVEDQGMFRSFLEQWLAGQPAYQLIGSAGSGEEALEIVTTRQPDLALVDMQLPGMDGLHFVRAARQIRPHLRALILTSLVDVLTLNRVREGGVEGYLEKDASPEQLAEALATISGGGSYYSRRYREDLSREGAHPEAVGKILSRREQEVLSHVLQGRTSREISELIVLSPRTVEFHRANIMSKLGASNIAELVAHARQRGLH